MDKDEKLKKILSAWPPGAVLTTRELVHRGYSHRLLNYYKRAGWIKLVHKGAYYRPAEQFPKPSLPGALYGILHDDTKSSIHLGGLSAIEFFGSAHFIQSGTRPKVWIFADPKEKFPLWLQVYDWNADVSFQSKKLFETDDGLVTKEWLGFAVKLSSLERAVLEFLALVPMEHTLDHAGYIVEPLRTLRPKLLQSLLEDCESVKAKRLLVALSDQAGLPWLRKLDLKKIDLGSGPISIEKGTSMHPKYQISLPKTLMENEVEVGA